MGIRMRHPEIAAYPTNTFDGGYPEALDDEQAALWEARGWERVIDDDVDFSKLRVADLRKLAAEQPSLDLSPKATKDELVAALEAARVQAYVEANAADAPTQIQGP